MYTINVYENVGITESNTLLKKHGGNIFPQRTWTSSLSALTDEHTLSNYNYTNYEAIKAGDIRDVGHTVETLTLWYWISGESDSTVWSYLLGWIDAIIADDAFWQADATENGYDLHTSAIVFGFSFLYDWYKDQLDSTRRNQVRDWLYYYGSGQYSVSSTGSQFWANHYIQNHCTINHLSLLQAALALLSDYPTDSNTWITQAKNKFNTMIQYYDAEGTWHEGHAYTDYQNFHLIRFAEILRQYDTVNYGTIFTATSTLKSYLQNCHKFFEALVESTDRTIYQPMGDAPAYKWYNPSEYFMKLYKEYSVSSLLDLARYYQSSYSRLPPHLVQGVYMDGTEGSGSAPSLADFDYLFFTDLGLLAEKKMTGSTVDIAFMFKSGTPGGIIQRNLYDAGTFNINSNVNISHSNPDQQEVVIYTPSGFLLEDTGYSGQANFSSRHNTLVIGTTGQLGETTSSTFNKTTAYSQPFTDGVTGLTTSNITRNSIYTLLKAEAHELYATSLNLSTFVRSVAWVKPNTFVIFDKVTVSSGTPNLKMYFHSQYDFILDSGHLFRINKPSSGNIGSFQQAYPSATVTVTDHSFGIQGLNNGDASGDRMEIAVDMPVGGTQYFINLVDVSATVSERTVTEQTGYFQVTVDGNVLTLEKSSGNITFEYAVVVNDNISISESLDIIRAAREINVNDSITTTDNVTSPFIYDPNTYLLSIYDNINLDDSIKYGLDFYSSDKVTVAANSNIDIKNYSTFTVEATIFPRSVGNAGRIVDKTNSSIGSKGYALYLNNNSGSSCKILANIAHATTNATFSSTGSPITYNQKNHVIMTYNEDGDLKIKIYVNGVQITSATVVAGAGALKDDSTNSLIIANRSSTNAQFDGLIYSIIVYGGKALTSTEAINRYSGIPVSGATANFDFHEGSGSTLNDIVNSLSGSISGANWEEVGTNLFISNALSVNDIISVAEYTEFTNDNNRVLTVNENVALVDNINAFTSIQISSIENINIIDSVTINNPLDQISVYDSIAIEDYLFSLSIISSNVLLIPIESTINVVDVLTNVRLPNALSINDTSGAVELISVTENKTVIASLVIDKSELISVNEQNYFLYQNFVNNYENISLNETNNIIQVYNIEINETINVVTVGSAFIVVFLGPSTEENITVEENNQLVITFFINLQDSISVQENIGLLNILSINTFESISIIDIVSMFITAPVISVFDSVSINETAFPTLPSSQVYLIFSSEELVLTENNSLIVNPLILNLSDNITLNETLDSQIVNFINKSENIILIESQEVKSIFNIVAFDNINIDDNSTQLLEIDIIDIGDDIFTQDYTQTNSIVFINKSELIGIVDNHSFNNFNYLITLHDSVVMEDPLETAFAKDISTNEAVLVQESKTMRSIVNSGIHIKLSSKIKRYFNL